MFAGAPLSSKSKNERTMRGAGEKARSGMARPAVQRAPVPAIDRVLVIELGYGIARLFS